MNVDLFALELRLNVALLKTYVEELGLQCVRCNVQHRVLSKMTRQLHSPMSMTWWALTLA